MKKKTIKKQAKPCKKEIKKATKPAATKKASKPTTKSTATKVTTTKKAVTTANKSNKPAVTQAQNGLVTIELRIHNDVNGGHPHIMIDTVNGKNVSVGTSHNKKKGKKHNNIPLEHNPLGGKEQAYMRKQGTVDDKKNYSSTSKTGKITVNDNAKAKKIGEKAKQKELKKQKSKK